VNDLLILARAVHFAATVTVAGAVFFIAFVADPAFRQTDSSKFTAAVRRRIAWTAWIALALSVLSGLAWLMLVAQSMSDRPLAEAMSQDVLSTVLSETDFGHDWLARFAAVCLLAGFFVPFFAPAARRPGWITGLVTLLAGGLVGSLAFAGHAVGGKGIEGVVHPAADVLHLLAAAGWVGALLPLAFVLGAAAGRPRLAAAYGVVARFSTLGIVCVATLLVSGAVNAWYLVGGVPALTGTDYGRLLLLKVALFLLMVIIAAINRVRLTPLLHDPATTPACALRRLRRNVVIEIVIGAAILAVVAVLGVTPPGVDAQAMPHGHVHSR
jgi:putative copper resistance protein D